ncbi:MAG: protein YghO [Gammaproteobacteria bacterium]|nr:MAG: protein YghO [Gammaproteobacteria bacterium]
MNNHLDTAVKITEVSGKKAMDTFIRVPWELYQNDPNWVPPLIAERKEAFSSKHPYFEHAEWQAWVAWRDGKPVGRISAQVDELHQQQYDSKTGFFGMLEATDDNEVFKALFNAAESWLRDRGMRQVVGPFNLSINQEIGILIEGFDSPPYVMTPHSLPYYGKAIEQCGYQPSQDLLAYELDSTTLTIPRVMQALLKRSADRVNVRPLQRKQKKAELEVMRSIFNDAWENNWNFVPFTRAEFAAIGKELMMLLPDEFIQIAELDGEAVAFVVLIPNINEAIADLNGRLLPFGWARLLWRLKIKFPKSARVALMGVRQKYQNTRFGPALAYMVIKNAMDAGTAKGLERAEMSWVLDHNQATRNIIESIGGEISKRYRMYEKDL